MSYSVRNIPRLAMKEHFKVVAVMAGEIRVGYRVLNRPPVVPGSEPDDSINTGTIVTDLDSVSADGFCRQLEELLEEVRRSGFEQGRAYVQRALTDPPKF